MMFITILLLFSSYVKALQYSQFIQTIVYPTDMDHSFIIDKLTANSPTDCASKCSEEAECRRVLFCKTGQLCWLFLDGADCISPLTTTSDCVCFQKAIGCKANGSCTCPWGQFGPNCREYITDCSDAFYRGLTAPIVEVRSYIKPVTAMEPFEVVCDFKSGGNTKLLDRYHGVNIIDFNRSLSEYEEGFGVNPRMHWLGFSKILQVLSNPSSRFLLTLTFVASNGTFCYTIYNYFDLGPAPNYQLSGTYLSGYSKCGDSLVGLIGKPFSSYDRDLTINKCSNEVGGGWWYKDDINGCSDTKGVLTAMPEAFWRNDMNNDKPLRVRLNLRRMQ